MKTLTKTRTRTALLGLALALYSAAALALPAWVTNPPPYGVVRTYYDHATGTVKGQYISCGQQSSGWGQSNGWSYRDQSIQCP